MIMKSKTRIAAMIYMRYVLRSIVFSTIYNFYKMGGIKASEM
jgi:hypothetical protein